MPLPITTFYASLLALLYIGLSNAVALTRIRLRVGIGDGENRLLARLIRVHGNFAEYVPFGVILLLLLESNGYSSHALHGYGVALVAARISHAVGLGRRAGASVPRFLGITATFVLIGVAACLLLLGIKL